jgi:DNA-binding transcriptional ArsR family regulator
MQKTYRGRGVVWCANSFIGIILHMNFYSHKSRGEKMKKSPTTICHRFFTNLANPTRLAAIQALMIQPQSVGELSTALGQEQSMVSHNLKPLLACNLIAIERQGKKHIYTANAETLTPIFAAIKSHAQRFCPSGGKCLRDEQT